MTSKPADIDPTSSESPEESEGDYFALTDEEKRLLRPARLAKTAATHLTQRDLTAEIHRMSASDTARLTRSVKKSATAPAAAVAQAMRTALARIPDERAVGALHDALHYGVLSTSETCELEPDELAALLTADAARLGFLVDYTLRETLIAGPEEFGVSADVRTAVWSSMACSGHNGAVAALGWLVADPPQYWTAPQRQAVADAWAQVRDRSPELPEHPVPLERLCEVVTELELSGELESLAVDTGNKSGTGDTGEEADLTDLFERVAALQARYATARDGALAALTADMADGRVPRADALVELVHLATDMTTLLERVADATDAPLAATFAQALDDLEAATASQTAAEAIGKIRRLVHLRAPEYVAAEASQVAALAATVDADTDPATLAALDALVSVVDLGATDPQDLADLVRVVQTGLPSATVLVMLAATGTLGFADAAVDAPLPPSAGTAPGTDGDTPDGGSADIAAAVVADADAPTDDGPVEGDAAVEDGLVEDVPVEDADAEEDAAVGEDAATEDVPGKDAPAEDGQAADGGSGDLLTDDDGPDDGPGDRGPEGDRPGPAADDAAPERAAEPEPSIDEVLAGLDLTIPGTGASPGTDARPEQPADAAPAVIDTDALYGSLMASRQYALAGWLSAAVGAPAAAATAHRLAAHAAAIHTSTGPNAAAFKDLAATLDADALRDLPGAQLLVYAAAVRAGLLSPTAGAADPLRDLCPAVVKSGPAVEELTEALLACIYSGAYLTPRSSNAVAEVAGLESDHASLVETARTLLETASSRTIRYSTATDLWKTWMAPHGYLGAALTLVASGSRRPEDLTFVRRRVAELRSRSDLESAIDRDTVIPAHAKRQRRIEARARDKVIQWAGDVTDVLAHWVEVTENLTQSSTTGWMSGQITELRSRVAALRPDALTQLRHLAHSDRHTRTAAIDAGLHLLETSLELLTAGLPVETGAELPPDRVRNGLLALAPDLPLDTTPTLTPRRTVAVTDIDAAAAALAADAAGWTAAFTARTEAGDHAATQVLVEMLRARDPQLARRLAAIRDRDVAAASAALDTHVAELAARIDSDRRYGRLSADAWSELSIRARGYEADARGGRRDFDVMEADLIGIEDDRAKQVAATIEGKWQQLADLQQRPDVTLTDDQAARISDCIAAEDITTADEYIETVRSHGELPAPRDTVDHLTRFFPAFPAAFTAAAATRGPGPLAALRRAMSAGQAPDTGPLADLLTGAQIDLSAVARPSTAVSRLEQWATLAGLRSLDGRLSQVKPVLEQLGFLAATANTPAHRAGQVLGVSSWMHLAGVRQTEGSALIPAFGSKISPSGDTLRVLAVWGSPTPGRLVELLREEPADHAVVLLYFGVLSVGARRELATLMRCGSRLPAAAVVDDAAFGYLSVQPTPRRDTTMAITLPFAASTPFTPDVAGLVPVEMFYGRTGELDQVIDMDGSCIVYGGRQLGKSALLRAAARKFDRGEHREAIYQSIYKVGQGSIGAEKIWPTLWPRLAEKRIVPDDLPGGDVSAAVINAITSWVHAIPGRQLLLLLDESDFFLDADASEGKFRHVAAFRDLMEQTGRAVKVVFAGLHQTARFERLANHPLAHFGNPVCVGPLAPQHAYDLLTEPLRALGYRFADDNVAARVLALANNQPSLIQLFGSRLLAHLTRCATPATLPQRVTADDVDAVWSDEGLRDAFRKRFDWTLNLDPRYKIIAYTVAWNAHTYGVGSALSPTELRSQCEQWWPQGFAAEDVRTGEFRALLDECVALGVLSYAPAEGAYRLRTPNVLALLGSRDEVDDVLDAAESTDLPDSFDGSLLRPAYAGGITRSPLTSAQIADLLAARNQVRVIAGSAALTVDRCARVLRDENDNAMYGARSIPIKTATAADLDTVCGRAAMAAPKSHAIVIADLRTGTHAAALAAWDRAREQIAARAGGTLGVVLITGPEQAPLWVRATAEADASSALTALHRYDNTGLRLWLNETSIPFQDDATRAELLAATGGWPLLLNRVAEAGSGDGDHGADALEELRGWLAQPANADAFVAALGVRSDEVLHAAWEFLLSALSGDATDPRTLAELMTLTAAEEPFAALRAERLTAAGYGGTDALVDVLRTLGVLVVSAADGQLRLEPVAAAAAGTAGAAGE